MNSDEAAKTYRERWRPDYETLASRTVGLLHDLVNAVDIPVAQIEHRAKTVESFTEKMARKRYTDPFAQIKDLAGVRIVTYYSDDAQRVADIIRDEFTVSADDSIDKFEDLDVNAFGYRSLHVVCRVSRARAALPEWERFADLFVEIQVRSVLQHAWAAISHKLDYKSPSQAPISLRRQLFRLSALLELADEEFTTVRDTSNELVAEYSEALPAGNLAYDINVQSLNAFLAERVDLDQWSERARRAGALPAQINPGEYERTVEFLVDLFQAMRLKTLGDVEALLLEVEPLGDDVLRRVAEVSRRQRHELEDFSLDAVLLALFATQGHRIPSDFRYPALWVKEFRAILDELRAWRPPQS